MASSRTSSLIGRSEPRLHTPELRKLTRKTTRGFEVIDFARDVLGQPLMPWQETVAKRALEVRPDGRPRFRTVLVLVARQSGKTHLLKVLANYWLFVEQQRLVLGVAQSLDVARESWQGAIDIAQDIPEMASMMTVRRTNGDEYVRLSNGSRYKISAATRSAGRGLSVDKLLMDELREQRSWDAWSALSKTTIARPDGQTFAISNAGDDESIVLNHLRDAALAGGDDSLGIFEWSAEDGCDLDDPDAWAQANPGLGHTITESAIRAALATDPPAVFRTEVLCQRVDVMDAAVPADAWNACADPVGTLDSSRNRVAFCLDISPDLEHATLVAAAVQPDGKARLEVVDAWSGPGCTQEIRKQLPALLERVKPRVVGWFPSGPAASLASDLRGLRSGQELKPADALTACQELAEQAIARRVLHPADPLLDAHVLGAQKLQSGDGWRFTRGRGAGHCDAAYAAAGALHLCRSLPVPSGAPRFILPR